MEWLSDNRGWPGSLASALAAVEAATVDFVFVMLAAALAGAGRRRSAPTSRSR